nr:hypothetical protein [uncultured Methanoregula sp.]
MKPYGIVLFILILAGLLVTGCTQSPMPSAPQSSTPVATTVTKNTPVSQPSFTLGDHYLQKSYSFQSENQVETEQFYVDNPSWGIGFTVLPLNDNINYCWFELKVTNTNNGRTDTYGYGRDNGFELTRQIPMYTTGPYKLEMKGNRVKVDVTAAKRNP